MLKTLAFRDVENDLGKRGLGRRPSAQPNGNIGRPGRDGKGRRRSVSSSADAPPNPKGPLCDETGAMSRGKRLAAFVGDEGQLRERASGGAREASPDRLQIEPGCEEVGKAKHSGAGVQDAAANQSAADSSRHDVDVRR
jgi:hypothetical protein